MKSTPNWMRFTDVYFVKGTQEKKNTKIYETQFS